MNSYKIRQTSLLGTIFIFLLILSGLRILFVALMLFMGGTEELSFLTVIMAPVYVVVFIVSIFMVIRTRRSDLVLNDDGLVYTPPLGATKLLFYSDLEKVSMGGRSYIIYTRDGKKLITFDDFRTQNASGIIAFLKSKGVPMEM
ncbi:hypothetical protein NSB25_05280 [Acetatifactor muris]|uniref:YcxB-like protein domain-containing protein n=1 Tax=Acetatifactor muris TaxID=879566 RepID=A0A2K4ZCT8_9FIRM|nr:hypothetical protein [Acetatifactor muris]MCI8799719.1 hypothetical protein [Lachnospiraceae bacterium]MCR2046690.1 hypothetical protein [Acetatifactor muris]SOY28282.1 hypothetical protein AMURIS_00989 [Acetatifactor muris]